MRLSMLFATLALGFALSAAPLGATYAAGGGGGGGGGGPSTTDPEFSDGQQALEREDWYDAAKSFEKVIALEPRNADAHNLLAYSYRRSGRLDPAFETYAMALDLDPRHKLAHEYLGEAYLIVGNREKAEEHLSILQGICGNGCEETKLLRAAIARYDDIAQHGESAVLAADETW